jgi:hypothetical protein
MFRSHGAVHKNKKHSWSVQGLKLHPKWNFIISDLLWVNQNQSGCLGTTFWLRKIWWPQTNTISKSFITIPCLVLGRGTGFWDVHTYNWPLHIALCMWHFQENPVSVILNLVRMSISLYLHWEEGPVHQENCILYNFRKLLCERKHKVVSKDGKSCQ